MSTRPSHSAKDRCGSLFGDLPQCVASRRRTAPPHLSITEADDVPVGARQGAELGWGSQFTQAGGQVRCYHPLCRLCAG